MRNRSVVGRSFRTSSGGNASGRLNSGLNVRLSVAFEIRKMAGGWPGFEFESAPPTSELVHPLDETECSESAAAAAAGDARVDGLRCEIVNEYAGVEPI